MQRSTAAVKHIQGRVGEMQQGARDLVAELRGIAEALRTAVILEPHWLDELAAEIREVHDRQDAAWSLGNTSIVSTTAHRRSNGRV